MSTFVEPETREHRLRRPQVGVEVELLPQGDVDRAEPLPDRRLERTLEREPRPLDRIDRRVGERVAEFLHGGLARELTVPGDLGAGGREEAQCRVGDGGTDPVSGDQRRVDRTAHAAWQFVWWEERGTRQAGTARYAGQGSTMRFATRVASSSIIRAPAGREQVAGPDDGAGARIHEHEPEDDGVARGAQLHRDEHVSRVAEGGDRAEVVGEEAGELLSCLRRRGAPASDAERHRVARVQRIAARGADDVRRVPPLPSEPPLLEDRLHGRVERGAGRGPRERAAPAGRISPPELRRCDHHAHRREGTQRRARWRWRRSLLRTRRQGEREGERQERNTRGID